MGFNVFIYLLTDQYNKPIRIIIQGNKKKPQTTNFLVGNDATAQNQLAETKKKIPHDRGKNSAHITTDQLVCALYFLNPNISDTSQKDTHKRVDTGDKEIGKQLFLPVLRCFSVKKKQLQTYPRTQQLCATNVRTEVDPSNNKDPCGCKVLKFVFGGVTLNILRSQTEDHFFLRMTLTALFVRLIINLRISIFKGKILINPGPEWCDNRFTAQPSERTKLLRPAHTPSIVQLYFAIYAYLRQNKNFLNFY